MRSPKQRTSASASTAPARQAGAVLALALVVCVLSGATRRGWAAAPDAPSPTPVPDPAVVAEIYDPATGRFTSTGRIASDRLLHSAALTPDGEVLVAAGLSTGPEVETYSPVTGKFMASSWDSPRSPGEPPDETAYDNTAALGLASATLLRDDRLMFIGAGYAFYNVATRTFTEVYTKDTDFKLANKGRVIVPLHNGQVLIIGGFTCPRGPTTPERDAAR